MAFPAYARLTSLMEELAVKTSACEFNVDCITVFSIDIPQSSLSAYI